MKIVMTGGHITPALAVLEALPKDARVVFIGRKHAFENDTSLSYEYQEITKRNIPFFQLKTGRLQRKLSLQGLVSLSKIPHGFLSAYQILKKENPDVILSFGGYVGFPVVYAGSLLHIPSVIHEQTLHAGFSNKLSSKIAKKICVSWEQSFSSFPKQKTVLTGNPLREDILTVLDQKPKKQTPPLLYITGGSAGSHEVNMLVWNHLSSLLDTYQIVHQTGDSREFNDYDELTKLQETLPKEKKERYTLFKFTSSVDAASYMATADVVIGRSGINTVSELLFLRKKSLLVPLHHGQTGEQMANALFLKNLGLSEIYTYNMDFMQMISQMVSTNYSLKGAFDNRLFTHAAERIVEVVYEASKKT